MSINFVILGLSLLLQMVTVYLGIRLMQRSGKCVAGLLIIVAIALMGFRRVVVLYRLFHEGPLRTDTMGEATGLVVSSLMVIGVLYLTRLILAEQKTLASLEQRVRERTAELEESNRLLRERNAELGQSGEEVRQSQQQLMNIIDFFPDATFVLDGEKKVVFWNKAMEKMSGLSKEEMVGQGDRAYTIPFYGERRMNLIDLLDEPLAELKAKYQDVQRNDRVLSADTFCPALYGGKGAYVWAAAAGLFDAEGVRVGAIESIRETTEYRKAKEALARAYAEMEQRVRERTAELDATNVSLAAEIEGHKQTLSSLREAKLLLEKTFESLNEAIFIVETGSRIILDCNPTCERMFGYTRPEMLGMTTNFLHISVERSQRFGREMEEAYAEKGFFETVYVMRKKDGSSFDSEHSVTPVRNELGAIVRHVCVVRDISERLRAEEALRSSESMARALLDIPVAAAFLLDPQGICLDVNETLAQRFGKERAAIIGTPVRQLFPGPVAAQRQLYFEEALRSKKQIRFEDQREGMWNDVILTPILDERGEVAKITVMGFDITERKKTEEQTLKIQKLESIGTLAGGIAHDFNNLLQGVFGYIALAKLHLGRENLEKGLAAIEEAEKARHLSVRLTQQLLTFAKGGKPVKRALELAPVIENAVRLALSGSRTGKRLAIGENLWPVEADDGQLSQVIQNMVLNADQAMPQGGIAEISAWNVPAAGLPRPDLLGEGIYVAIAIKDEGQGIAPEHLGRIFDPYFTTKKQGSGLGLATSYSIIKNHGGLIQVVSAPGAGSTFTIYLPATGVLPEAEPEAVTPLCPRPGGERILLMDDELLVRTVGGELLQALGHEVEYAVDGEEAIARYRAAREAGQPFAVVILDLTIKGGGMGGEEAAQQLLALDPAVKTVVSTGYSDDTIVANFRAYGFKAFLNKPYRMEELERILGELLGG